MMRTIDPEHNWFWQQGYADGFEGLRAIAPTRLGTHFSAAIISPAMTRVRKTARQRP